ncbi:MAG TPA: di-heme oxidoredictase family protein [Polyangiaceae bacterium]|nr:di-heme oxidoredictase family protein [Polyangiaceae bacterium]
MSYRALLPLLWLVTLGCSSNKNPQQQPAADPLSGGEGTTFTVGKNAFAQAAENLVGDRRDPFFDGNALFNRNWATAPASAVGVDGLGPTYNARSCSSCHFKDGRGRPPFSEDEAMSSMLIRLSVPGTDEHGGPKPEPTYGGQLNPLGILGVPGEGDPRVVTSLESGKYDDGTSYELSVPSYELRDLAYGEMSADVMLSPRTAPQMIGLGLLQAIDEADLLANADEKDRDHDGISGRPNHVWDVAKADVALGRFGWKANQPRLEQQNSGAFLGDIGITSPLFPSENCTEAQTACSAAVNGGSPEIDHDRVDVVDYYSKYLAVPARRRTGDAQVLQGEQLFTDLGCSGCHIKTFKTGTVEDFPELSQQTIHPYTDLLLHDMGDALADGRPDFEANGNEWRTPPLWGVGLFKDVNDHTRYLHDGRARNLEEAVLWHGGEAQDSADAFKALSKSEREALITFLGSL